ncbi:cytochrome p450 protein [Penicillium riverlandense]|uniref:cytochrome p450 protein n=1 Tax=Penicillium riverlandense TaxID=1903569 RepID=UPI002548B053|nr:cytochrome p450 protein [Penicillium riverlandense]KAJ5825231.1 cytochrome p450 protein [Penicillium riverlandense]
MHLPDQWPLSGVTTSWAAALMVVIISSFYLSSAKLHPQEPPVITSVVPFVGHLLGMIVNGGRYIKSIGITNRDKPIFTLPMPRSRIYVVTDPVLAAAVQRASRALSFTPLVPDITKRVLGLDDATVAAVRQNLDPEPGDDRRGFLADMHDMMYRHLGPGEALESLSSGAATELSRQINTYVADLQHRQPGGVPAVKVDLLEWVRHFVTVGTAQFLYGPNNPIAVHPELEQAFWDFDHGLGLLLMGLAPSITARKPYRGREALASAFTEYITAGYEREAAAIVRKRVAIAEEYGWPASSTARSELSFLFAGIVNTATTTFWVVLQIFARPELLAAVRSELSKFAGKGEGERTLSMDGVKNECPILQAVFRECLRLGSNNFSTRLVKTDTLLVERYLLKANSVVQVAGGVIHADKQIWGDDVDVFNPGRFLKPQQGGSARPSVHPAAFRSFGGGKTLCPGRHFATIEILSLVAMIVLTFDLEAVGGGRSLCLLRTMVYCLYTFSSPRRLMPSRS